MANHLDLTHDKLSLDRINDLVKSPKCGAISMFIGTTRDNFDGKDVVKLEYEAYKPMALKSMQTLCDKVRTKYANIENIVIHHRLGEVPIGESSIIIATSSVHRKEAIEATQTLIDSLKQSTPIWKKEFYNESQCDWKENKESQSNRKNQLSNPQSITIPLIPPHLIQIKADKEEIDRRIEKFMEHKREEINRNNVREFCRRELNVEVDKNSCARIDSILLKRKDSKSHLQVNRVLNSYNRDDESTIEMLLKNQPKNGVEERLINLEVQLSLTKPTPKNIYVRLKRLEDRMLHVESISPEYLYIWGKNNIPSNLTKKSTNKKKTFTLMDIDNLISDLKNKKT